MLRSVEEVSVLTGLSKVSIYNKIKLKEIEKYVVKNKGITYISDEGINLIFRLNKSSTYHDIELPFNLNIASISLFGSKLVYSEYSIFYDDRIFRILYII